MISEATKLLTVAEVAELLGVARSTLYEEMSRGKLPWHKIGRCRRIAVPDLDAYLAANRYPQTESVNA